MVTATLDFIFWGVLRFDNLVNESLGGGGTECSVWGWTRMPVRMGKDAEVDTRLLLMQICAGMFTSSTCSQSWNRGLSMNGDCPCYLDSSLQMTPWQWLQAEHFGHPTEGNLHERWTGYNLGSYGELVACLICFQSHRKQNGFEVPSGVRLWI